MYSLNSIANNGYARSVVSYRRSMQRRLARLTGTKVKLMSLDTYGKIGLSPKWQWFEFMGPVGYHACRIVLTGSFNGPNGIEDYPRKEFIVPLSYVNAPFGMRLFYTITFYSRKTNRLEVQERVREVISWINDKGMGVSPSRALENAGTMRYAPSDSNPGHWQFGNNVEVIRDPRWVRFKNVIVHEFPKVLVDGQFILEYGVRATKKDAEDSARFRYRIMHRVKELPNYIAMKFGEYGLEYEIRNEHTSNCAPLGLPNVPAYAD